MRTSSLHEVFDRMLTLNRTMEAAAYEPSWTELSDGRVRPQLWLPPVDIYETETAFVVAADLPGVHRENVEIQFDRNTLTIAGTRAATLPAKEESQLRVFSAGRLSGAFSRSVRLPEHVDAEKIHANFVDGVLMVTVPKAKGALPRKIAIAGSDEQRKLTV